MVLQIDDLKLPPSISGSAELFNRDSQKRTVSGRLITKLDTSEKWRLTVSYEESALTLDFQARFYAKCLEMRSGALPVTFISPYDGEEYTVTAKCVSRAAPSAFSLFKRRPEYYIKAGAVFEEV